MDDKPKPDFSIEALLKEVRPSGLLRPYDGPGAYTAEELAEQDQVNRDTVYKWTPDDLKNKNYIRVRIRRGSKSYKAFVLKEVFDWWQANKGAESTLTNPE